MEENKKPTLTKEEINKAVEDVIRDKIATNGVMTLYCYDIESMKYFSKAFKEEVEKWKNQK